MRNLSKDSFFDYLLLGVILALGTLSKYNYVLLPTALLIVSFLDAPLRRLLFNYKFIATILVFSFMVSPHIYWVVSHLSSAVDGTLNKIHSGEKKTVLEILLQFTLSIIELFALYFIIYFSLFFNSIQKKSDPFLKKVIFTVLVLLLSILLFLSANRIDGRWFVVLLFPVVILLSTKLDNASLARIRYYLYISLFFMFIIITVYLFRFYSPDSFKSAPRFNFPYAKIYNTLHLESYKNIYSPTSLCSGNLKFISSKLNIEKPSKTLQPNSLFIIDKDAFSQIAYFEKRYGIKFTKTSFVYTNSKSTFLIYYFKTNKKSYTISKTIH